VGQTAGFGSDFDRLSFGTLRDQVFPVVGVFVVKDGRITEWVDYLDK